MKKLISIILSIVLVISCIGNAFIMPISAEAAYKSVTAECFDNDYDITKAYGEGVLLLGKGEFGSSGPKSGEHSVKFGEMGTTSPKAYVPIYANDRQKAYVEQGKTYRISLYMTVQSNGAFYIAYTNDESLTFAGTENTAWIFNSNDTAAVVNKGWQKLETTFTAAQSGYIWVGKESNTLACWIDNVVLCEDGTSTITFMDGENTLNTLSGNSGDLIGTLPVPTAEGKTFSNWCTDAELTNNFSEKYYPVGNVTLYAKWNDGTVIAEDFENYTVDSNWNSEAVIATDETSGNKSLYFAKAAETNDYAFIYNNDNIVNAYVEQGKNYRLYFKINVVNQVGGVWFGISNSATDFSSATTYLMYNSSNTTGTGQWRGKGWTEVCFEFTAAKSGYVFIGKNSGTLNAYFDDIRLALANTTTITFQTNNDSVVVDAKTGNAGTELGALTRPSVPGMQFEGWYSDEDLTKPFVSAYYPNYSKTLYAKWSRYVVTAECFDDNYDITKAYGADVLLLGKGEFGSSGPYSGEHSVKFGEYGTESAKAYVPIYANNRQKAYVEQGKTYRISLYMTAQTNGAFYIAYANDESLTFAGTEKTDWIFNSSNTGDIKNQGWKKLETTFTAAQSGYIWVGKEKNTLACWVDNVVLCEVGSSTLTFMDGETTVATLNGNTGDLIGALPVPESSVSGMMLTGWYMDADCTTEFTDTYFATGNLTLYAKWERYVVTAECFDDNYDITKAYGEDVFLLGDGEFGSSGPKSGEHSVKFVENMNSAKAYVPIYANNRQKAYVEKGKTYYISMYMTVQKNGAFYIAYANDESLTFAGTEKTAWIFNSSNTGDIKNQGWKKLETTFTAEKTGYIWVGKESNSNTNTLTCWIDNVVLCEATTPAITLMDGTTVINTITVNSGNEVNIPKQQATFDEVIGKWYLDADCTVEYKDAYYPTYDLTLYAKWEKNSAIVTAYNNSAALRVGANSSTGKNGLRIYNSIDVSRMENANIVEFGSIASMESTFEGEELTIDMKGTKGIGVGVAYSEEKGISTFWDQTDDAIYFTSYLTGINPEYYGENFLIRTYAIDENGKVYYGDTVSVSVFDVAYSIDLGNSVDGNEPSTEDIAAFNAFANFGNNGYAEYTEWLTANNKTAGNISGSK